MSNINTQITIENAGHGVNRAVAEESAKALTGGTFNNDIIQQALDKKRLEALQGLAEIVLNDTNIYVPYKTGALTQSGAVVVTENGVQLGYEEPYAVYAFTPNAPSGKAKNYTKTAHPEARGEPIEYSFSVNSDKWAEYVAKEVLGNG